MDPDFKSFLKKMIEKDAKKRATITELLSDDFLTNKGSNPIDLYIEDFTDFSMSIEGMSYKD